MLRYRGAFTAKETALRYGWQEEEAAVLLETLCERKEAVAAALETLRGRKEAADGEAELYYYHAAV